MNGGFEYGRATIEMHRDAVSPGQCMLIHDDLLAPGGSAEAMRRALISAGNAPGWIYEETEGHGFFDPQKRLNAYQQIVNFLDKHIGPQAK